MKLFRKNKKVKNRMLKALMNFDASIEGYHVREGEYIFITSDKEYHKMLFITEERAKEFLEKEIDNKPIVEEVEL